MAPCNGTTSTPAKLAVTLPYPHYSKLQWHPAMAPSNGTTSTPSKLVVTFPQTIAHYIVQWHPAMAPLPAPTIAHCNGTVQWQPAMAPRPLPKVGRPSLSTIAHYNDTLRWHSNGTTSTAPCNGTVVPRPIRQTGSSPSPHIGSKNPYSYRYLGKKTWCPCGTCGMSDLQGLVLSRPLSATSRPLSATSRTAELRTLGAELKKCSEVKFSYTKLKRKNWIKLNLMNWIVQLNFLEFWSCLFFESVTSVEESFRNLSQMTVLRVQISPGICAFLVRSWKRINWSW